MTRRLLFVVFATLMHAEEPTFRAQAPLVIVPVTVSDQERNPVYGLTASDFRLLDDDQPQRFHVDPPGEYNAGVSAVIVVQISGVSGSALAKIKKTGSLITGYITGEGGDAATITVDSDIHLAQNFTSDTDAIENSFRSLKAGDQMSGRDLDGVKEALTLLASRDRNRRRVVVLISETRDRGSQAKLPEIVRLAQQENATIWAISYSAYVTAFTTRATDWQEQGGDKSPNYLAALTEPMRLAKPNIADELARYTGGRHLSFARLKALEDDLASIGKEVHSQYVLSFIPSKDSPGLHRIQVQVTNHSTAVLRYRPVYWKVTSSPSAPNAGDHTSALP